MAKDSYATELYMFVCQEAELVNILTRMYQFQADYHQQVCNITQSSLPAMSDVLALSPRKFVFGIPLDQHLSCINRPLSLVIELCIHFLSIHGLNEEGLFRIPGTTTRIKKLKNAINAWFISLSNQDDLECKSTESSSVRALRVVHDLIKDTVIQKLSGTSNSFSGESNMGPGTTVVTNHLVISKDAQTHLTSQGGSSLNLSTNPQSNQSSSNSNNDTFFDAHTMAGLLKLYLRELPEPLLTYDLYSDWIEAIVKINSSNDVTENHQCDSVILLEQIVNRLPKAHYDNLSHLIRFLNLLTTHSDTNKMTATNLAITMAPSLIRTPTHCTNTSSNNNLIQSQVSDPSQNQALLSMEMTTFGMSASQHASLIERLIRHAEQLFPGAVQFHVPEFYDTVCGSSLYPSEFANEVELKSTSPASLSYASSSSFSSNSISSSSTNDQQLTLGKETESGGLLNVVHDLNSALPHHESMESNEKLDSANQIRLGGTSTPPHNNIKCSVNQTAPPPPIPPAPSPALRSHLRHASDSAASPRYTIAKQLMTTTMTSTKLNPQAANIQHSSSTTTTTSTKPPAPPPPPHPSTLRRSQHVSARPAAPGSRNHPESLIQDESGKTLDGAKVSSITSSMNKCQTTAISGPVSLRGTGIAPASSSSCPNNPNATRPSVPPPNRPASQQSAL